MARHDIYFTVNLWGISENDLEQLIARVQNTVNEYELDEPVTVINWDWLD